MKEVVQTGGDFGFQRGDAISDAGGTLRLLIFVEVPGHGEFKADFGLAVVDPRIRSIRHSLAVLRSTCLEYVWQMLPRRMGYP